MVNMREPCPPHISKKIMRFKLILIKSMESQRSEDGTLRVKSTCLTLWLIDLKNSKTEQPDLSNHVQID